MPILNLEELRKRLLWPSDDEAERAFTTYKNYLLHINKGLGGVYGVGGSMIPSIVTAPALAGDHGACLRDMQQPLALGA